MLVICDNYKNCKTPQRKCGHNIPHKHNSQCELDCVSVDYETNCRCVNINKLERKDKLKKLEL